MDDILEAKLSFLKRVFGTVQASKDAKNVAISCPKCKNSQKKKLAIRLDDDRVHCWVCGQGGKLVNLLIKFKPMYVYEYVSKFVGQNIVLLSDELEKKTAEVPRNFKLLANNMKSIDPNVRASIKYLTNRGLTERDFWYFKFGVSDDSALIRRVIMPSFNNDGELNFFTGRAIDKDAYRKYMNCDVKKKAIIFNELNIDWKKELTLVEGPFDLTKCDDNATCLLGSSLSEDSALFSKIYQNMTPIILALDSDMVDKSWQRIAKMLSSYDISVRILDLGKFKDVGEMKKEEFLVAKKAAREWSRIDALKMKISSIKK